MKFVNHPRGGVSPHRNKESWKPQWYVPDCLFVHLFGDSLRSLVHCGPSVLNSWHGREDMCLCFPRPTGFAFNCCHQLDIVMRWFPVLVRSLAWFPKRTACFRSSNSEATSCWAGNSAQRERSSGCNWFGTPFPRRRSRVRLGAGLHAKGTLLVLWVQPGAEPLLVRIGGGTSLACRRCVCVWGAGGGPGQLAGFQTIAWVGLEVRPAMPPSWFGAMELSEQAPAQHRAPEMLIQPREMGSQLITSHWHVQIVRSSETHLAMSPQACGCGPVSCIGAAFGPREEVKFVAKRPRFRKRTAACSGTTEERSQWDAFLTELRLGILGASSPVYVLALCLRFSGGCSNSSSRRRWSLKEMEYGTTTWQALLHLWKNGAGRERSASNILMGPFVRGCKRAVETWASQSSLMAIALTQVRKWSHLWPGLNQRNLQIPGQVCVFASVYCQLWRSVGHFSQRWAWSSGDSCVEPVHIHCVNLYAPVMVTVNIMKSRHDASCCACETNAGHPSQGNMTRSNSCISNCF